MKRIIFITIFVFLMCSFSSAQSLLPELERAKQIKFMNAPIANQNKVLVDLCCSKKFNHSLRRSIS